MRLPNLEPQQLGRPKLRLRNPIMEGVGYVLRAPLFDYYGVTVATVVTRQILFTVPKGQAYTPAGGAALTKSEWHTNMEQAGILPSPRKFYIKGIQVSVRSDTAVADLHRFLYDTLVDLQISSKSYLGTAPGGAHAFKFPQGGGAAGGSAGLVQNGWPDVRNEFECYGDMGEVIEQQQGISVTLDPTRVTDAGANTTFTTATAANGGTGINAFVFLDGLLTREVTG